MRTLRQSRPIHMRDEYVVDDTPDTVDRGSSMAARVISLIGSLIVGVLALRFVFSLLGANRGNVIADFVYSVSAPFVTPFFGLFNYTPQFGVVRFEFETLIAMAFYAVLTAVLVRIALLGRRYD
jgi:YggT family protein